jgi:hypothetical protein
MHHSMPENSKKSNFSPLRDVPGQVTQVGVRMPWIPNNKLKALRYYIDYCDLCGLPLDVLVFDAAALQVWKARVTNLDDFAKIKAAEKNQPHKPLLVFAN